MQRKFLILLTSTVNPTFYRDQTLLVDKRERLNQYLNAVKFWLNHPDDRIGGVVFCDNSGADSELFANLESSVGREFEFLSFVDTERPQGVHYGYGELGIIDFAVANSRLFQKNDNIIKVTGRLIFPTISKLLDEIDPRILFAIDCYRIRSRGIRYPFRARTQLLYFKREFYSKHFQESRHEMIGYCSHIEEFIPRKLELLHLPDPLLSLRWRSECIANGVGSNRNNYQSLGNNIKYAVRGLLRYFLPNIWL
ncbi:hypothetical protein [Aquidulcibacter paucihalophilus]|uniref:hypothetical protein n=1 Tax=Aquidulcibacter paucihalophilus TaxID=1978549 RepID=UPI0012FFBFE2|nr:hypothetical protein [Aquidulcibacter paucihalophilus]